ncbi:DUF4439 domain-containing protein [Nocardioides sp.]|uniref:DUF4439 domain-containing protein n=1 Tax=Nocardioides sp. TaxID=35761 RepID=UPI0026212C27|nr:DUF4439 domain-containing protein [Nocardioides sp.]
MPSVRPAPSRRAALAAGGLVAGITTVSCGRDEGDPRGSHAGSSSRSSRGPSVAADDEAVVAGARTDLLALDLLVAATRRRHRPLRGRLADLQRTHRAQLAELDPDGAATPPARRPRVGADPAAALASLLREEERLQRRMVTWCVAADSGPLARLLASVAAGSAQQVALLAPGDGADRAWVERLDGTGRAAGPEGLDALQRVLAFEHAAVWVLGSAGAATSMSATPELFERLSGAHESHRSRRDRLAAALLAQGAEPVQSEAAYAVPEDLSSPGTAAEAAVRVERSSATAWAFLVASSTGATRRWAAQVLTSVAVSAVGLGGDSEPLPGAGDLSR